MPKLHKKVPASSQSDIVRDPGTGRFVTKLHQRRRTPAAKATNMDSDVLGQADRVFGSHEKAVRWLERPHPALNNKAPLQLLATEDGVARVRDMLIRIDHGIIG